MGAPFNGAGGTSDRLPIVIRGLDARSRRVYVALRLRKNEAEIGGCLGISVDEVQRIIGEVRHALARAGQLDLVDSPKFVSLEDEEGRELPLSAGETSAEGRALLNEFLAHAREAVAGLPPEQALLLKLRFGHGLTAAQIMEFGRRVGFNPLPGKSPDGLKDQDVYTALNAALKGVLLHLRKTYGERNICGLEGLKYVFEETGL